MESVRIALIETHADRLLLYARTWCPSMSDAEDALQEASMRFLDADGMENPLAYLYRCIRSAALDQIRGERRRARREADAADGRTEACFACSIEGEEVRLAVDRALADLPGDQREVVVLRVWGEQTFPAIAAIAGIPEDTARSRYRYALDRLRGRLSSLEAS